MQIFQQNLNGGVYDVLFDRALLEKHVRNFPKTCLEKKRFEMTVISNDGVPNSPLVFVDERMKFPIIPYSLALV